MTARLRFARLTAHLDDYRNWPGFPRSTPTHPRRRRLPASRGTSTTRPGTSPTSWCSRCVKASSPERVVRASGNLGVCGHQFWLGPGLGGIPITLRIDTTVVHILRGQARLKTVPSRFTPAQLRQLLADGATVAGPPPSAAARTTGPFEVDRLVNARGLVGLAGRQHLPPGRTTRHRPHRRRRHADPRPRPHPATDPAQPAWTRRPVTVPRRPTRRPTTTHPRNTGRARILGPLVALPLITRLGSAGWVVVAATMLSASFGLAVIGPTRSVFRPAAAAA